MPTSTRILSDHVYRETTKGMKHWTLMRLLLWGAFVVGPWLSLDPLGMTWRHVMIQSAAIFLVSLLWPLGVCGMNRVSDRMGSSSQLWLRPSISVSPFRKSKPLQFWWTMDVAFLLTGVSAILSATVHSAEHLKYGLIWIAFGIGGLLGIRVCLRLFRHSFEPRAQEGAPESAIPCSNT